MKKERNARKKLNDLYFYMDMIVDNIYDALETQRERFKKLCEKYDKRFFKRQREPYEWEEYYGIFKTKSKKIRVDPKRFSKTLNYTFSNEALEIISRRRTTYFYPKKKEYLDYVANNFVNAINELKNEFQTVTCPLIEKSVESINKKRKTYTPGDNALFQMGIYDAEEANESCAMNTIMNNIKLDREISELIISLSSQFFHYMASRIESLSIAFYKKIDSTKTDWKRKYLYTFNNKKGISGYDLKHYQFHDKMYSIWNFIKHGNQTSFNTLKKKYPNVLLSANYKEGKKSKYYVKLDKKLILDLMEGVKLFFIEWCDANLDENPNEISWNYEDFFIDKYKNEIETINNPLGLEPFI